MFEISHIACCVYLGMLSVIDIWMQKLPLWLLAAGGVGAGIIRTVQKEVPLIIVLSGAAVGIVFLVVSKITEEGFGYGDSLLILFLGIFLGFWSLLGVLMGAFLLSAIFAVIALVCKRLKRNTRYPFVPFLLAAYIVWMCLGGN